MLADLVPSRNASRIRVRNIIAPVPEIVIQLIQMNWESETEKVKSEKMHGGKRIWVRGDKSEPKKGGSEGRGVWTQRSVC